jgi:hypothetical protein
VLNDVLDRIEAAQAIDLPPEATSLTLLQAVYRNPALPLPTRMRAAGMALQFEHPKLAVTALTTEGGFADRLDRAIERSNRVRQIADGKVIDHEPTKAIEAKPEARPPERRRA